MSLSLRQRTLRVGLSLGAAAGIVAFAVPSPVQADTLPIQITAAGSDTTELLMDQILNGANQTNIHSQDPAITFSYTVPADDRCGVATYKSPTAVAPDFVAPQGSGAGRNAVKNSIAGTFPDATVGAGKGCVDIARSSADPRQTAGGDLISFEYYAFALDMVTWASPSLNAPGTLTNQQIKDIYSCKITNWAQLPGGGSGAIKRYYPSLSSGTGTTFTNKVLGGAAPAAARAIDTATFGSLDLGCSAVVTIVENHGNDPLLLGADYQNAIVPYSSAKYSYQANNSANPTIDIRAGVRLGGFTNTNQASPANPSNPITWDATAAGTNGSTYPVTWNAGSKKFFLNSAVVNDTNEGSPTPTYPGVRFVYNVIDQNSPSYTTAAGLVAYDISGATTAKSPLCAGSKSSVILSQGFLPIAASTQNGNPGVTCRLKLETS